LFDTLKEHLNQWGGSVSLFFCFTHFSHDLMTSLLITMLPFIRQDMMLNYFQAGLLVSAYSITSGLSQILGGWIGDRIRHRWMSITLGLIGVGICGLAAGMMYSFESLLVAMVFMGIFAGAYHPAAVPAISSLFGDQRGKAIGLHMIGGAIGFGLGPFIGTAIAATIGWHVAFILLSIPALAAGVSVAVWLRKIEPDIPRHTAAADRGKQAGADSPSIWQVLKKVSVVFILVIVVTFTSGSLLPFIPLYMVDHYNLSATMAAVWTSILRASGILGGLFGGWLSDRWGNRNAVLLALIAIGPAILLFTTVGYFPALAVMMIAIGILWMMRETVVQTYLMTKTPPSKHGLVVGIYFGIGQQGQSLLQPVYGVFMDMAGISTVFLIVGLISLATSIVTIFLARKI
jgi:FSR family fosmidomycin resistance protein-like MFS transporter